MCCKGVFFCFVAFIVASTVLVVAFGVPYWRDYWFDDEYDPHMVYEGLWETCDSRYSYCYSWIDTYYRRHKTGEAHLKNKSICGHCT